jgi:antitoxin HigA-1
MSPPPHPGTLLQRQYLTPLCISQNRLARALGVPPRRINEIVLGKRAISADTAVRLAQYFGNDPLDWMRMQAEYDIARATINLGSQIHNIRQPNPSSDENRPATAPTAAQNKNIRKRILR